MGGRCCFFNPVTAWALQDIHALSHEIAEWGDDPFVNNTVEPWLTPTAPQYGCTGVLETGDPVVGIGFAKGTNSFEQGPTPQRHPGRRRLLPPRGRGVYAVVHAAEPKHLTGCPVRHRRPVHTDGQPQPLRRFQDASHWLLTEPAHSAPGGQPASRRAACPDRQIRAGLSGHPACSAAPQPLATGA